eukprot:11622900-Alexandrium_andersonii.AAC.1
MIPGFAAHVKWLQHHIKKDQAYTHALADYKQKVLEGVAKVINEHMAFAQMKVAMPVEHANLKAQLFCAQHFAGKPEHLH